MPGILRAIENYALAIYITCTAGVLFYLRFFVQARREERQSIFSLEREVAANQARRAMIIMFIFLAIMAVTAYLNLIAIPAQGGSIPLPTATPVQLILPTLTPSPTATPTSTPRPRPTRRPPPTRTPVQPTPTTAAPPPSCPSPGVQITSPGTNARVQGIVPIRGTASIANFDFYKVEYGAGDKPSEWHSISPVHRQAVVNGDLDVWNTAGFPPGTYTLRLTVVDKTSNFPPPCQVRVIIP
jgi:hypothetical protein